MLVRFTNNVVFLWCSNSFLTLNAYFNVVCIRCRVKAESQRGSKFIFCTWNLKLNSQLIIVAISVQILPIEPQGQHHQAQSWGSMDKIGADIAVASWLFKFQLFEIQPFILHTVFRISRSTSTYKSAQFMHEGDQTECKLLPRNIS